MRRINIHLDEDLDAELAAEAARTGESKASLLRRAARLLLDRRAEEANPADPWASFTGAARAEGDHGAHDDDVIYRA